MAIRVRKLAKRLGRTSVEVLGVLHALGIDRYKSPEDMLSNSIEAKLLRGLKDGVKPLELEPVAVRKAAPVVVEAVSDGIFSGVTRRTVDDRFESAPIAKPIAKDVERAPVEAPVAVHEEVRAAPSPVPVSPAADLLRAEREAFESARIALQHERELLAAERVNRSAALPASPLLTSVLEERGLRGADEFERTIRVLAENRRMSELLPYLTVNDPAGLLAHLHNVLHLVDGKPPEGLSGSLVAVAPERSEVPGAAEWRRLTGKLSEALLLVGARRVLVVGGSARMHRLLANALDPRIEIRFRPARTVTAVDAEADVARTDSIALWQVDVDDASQAIYGAGRAVVSTVVRPSVRSLLDTWVRDLADA